MCEVHRDSSLTKLGSSIESNSVMEDSKCSNDEENCNPFLGSIEAYGCLRSVSRWQPIPCCLARIPSDHWREYKRSGRRIWWETNYKHRTSENKSSIEAHQECSFDCGRSQPVTSADVPKLCCSFRITGRRDQLCQMQPTSSNEIIIIEIIIIIVLAKTSSSVVQFSCQEEGQRANYSSYWTDYRIFCTYLSYFSILFNIISFSILLTSLLGGSKCPAIVFSVYKKQNN